MQYTILDFSFDTITLLRLILNCKINSVNQNIHIMLLISSILIIILQQYQIFVCFGEIYTGVLMNKGYDERIKRGKMFTSENLVRVFRIPVLFLQLFKIQKVKKWKDENPFNPKANIMLKGIQQNNFPIVKQDRDALFHNCQVYYPYKPACLW